MPFVFGDFVFVYSLILLTLVVVGGIRLILISVEQKWSQRYVFVLVELSSHDASLLHYALRYVVESVGKAVSLSEHCIVGHLTVVVIAHEIARHCRCHVVYGGCGKAHRVIVHHVIAVVVVWQLKSAIARERFLLPH